MLEFHKGSVLIIITASRGNIVVELVGFFVISFETYPLIFAGLLFTPEYNKM